MTSIVGPSGSNSDIERGILHTWIFLATHPHRVQVWATSLHKVPEDSVRRTTTGRLSWSLVGLIHHRPTY
jgi:hypothetical protein